ncbi:MAG TPA: hypothetical protein VG096_04760 [Bryobacteraceae bacterium]|jgi:hypothetical protein|nr:hypothetical protein [Bryobacteraceae bacterium]
MKQPALGIVASVLVMAIALGFVSLFDLPQFTGWVAFLLICLIPMEIVVGITWGCQNPGFAARRQQPAKGILLVMLTLAVGVIVAAVHHRTVGGQISPPAPMLAMCMIISVLTTFWLAIMWGGWPFTKVIKNPVAAGLTMLVAAYAINYLIFRTFFSYEFMRGAPVYAAQLDPHGMFNAWNALVFYLTVIGVLFLSLNFDLWPFTTSPTVMQQPVLGIVWTAVALVIGGAAFYIGVVAMGMDVVSFMVKVPIPFIFGTIIVVNMMQGSIFGKLAQPLKGVLNTIASAVIGSVLALIYSALAPVVTGAVNAGPPSYDFEIWLASALLAVTFPFLIFYAEFFQFWPLRKAEQPKAVSAGHA